MARVGVVLSGCGVYDGAEIHEAVLTLLALDEAGAEAIIMAPSGPQMHVINHLTGEVSEEPRDILVESARIARGEIKALSEVSFEELDALLFPGGFGVAKNLCDFAINGVECSTHPGVARLVAEMYAAKKPLGFACIAPAMAAAIFRDAGIEGVQLTVGCCEDEAAQAVKVMGAQHITCTAKEISVDEANRIVSTPAYMVGQRISEVREGLKLMVDRLLDMGASPQ